MNNLERLSTSAVSVQDSLQAKANLEWIANRWHDLKARLIPSNTPNTGASRPAPTSRPPLRLDVSNLLFEIEYETRLYAHELTHETHNWQPRSSTMPQLLLDVAEMHGHWTTQNDEIALEFINWVNTHRRDTERALENPPNPQYLGPCPCHGDLYLQPGTRVAKCRLCKQTTPLETQMAYVQEVLQDRLMTLGEIRAALVILDHPRPIGTLKTWAHQGRLIPDPTGLYPLKDALELSKTANTRRRKFDNP